MIAFNLPVEIQTSGEISEDLELVGIEVSPESVPVMISSKHHSGSLKIMTSTIDLPRITESVTLTPNLILPNGATYTEEKPPEVAVKVDVRKKEVEQPDQPEQPELPELPGELEEMKQP